jgi:hypothetical protein
MTSPSSTVTDKLVKQAKFLLGRKLEAEYERHFPYITAGDEFFDRLTVVETKLATVLEKRPITKAEINSMGDRAFKSLRSIMLKIAKTIKQPQFVEATNMETGAVRLIPDYNELP